MLILTPWRKTLFDAFAIARHEVIIVSPFIKTAIAANVTATLDRPGLKVRTITRFKPEDFSSSVSDIDAAWMLSSYAGDRVGNFDIRTDNKLHAKIYLVDREVVFIGSSNLTFSGLMLNYEACVRTTDPDVLTSLNDELEKYWLGCRCLSEADFAGMLDQLRTRGRTQSVENEHIYDISIPLNLFEVSDHQEDPDWLDTDMVSAPVERITTLLNPVASPISVEGAPGEVEAAGSPASHVDLLTALDQRVGDFLNALEKMGLPARKNSHLYSLSIRHPFLRSLAGKINGAGGHLTNIEPERFLGASDNLDTIGCRAFEIACFKIASRSGILRRFGRAGMSMMISAVPGRSVLSTLWNENFIGPLLAVSDITVSERNSEDAVKRLFGAIALTEGLEASTQFIERYFNPLDILGSDMVSILAFKDPKTSLQEITQAHGLKPIYSRYVNDGTDHQTAWRCEVQVGKVIHAVGSGVRKSDAEKDAAKGHYVSPASSSLYQNRPTRTS